MTLVSRMGMVVMHHAAVKPTLASCSSRDHVPPWEAGEGERTARLEFPSWIGGVLSCVGLGAVVRSAHDEFKATVDAKSKEETARAP